jgi:hypothetical protein
MFRAFLLAAPLALTAAASAQEARYDIPEDVRETVQALREAGLESDLAYEITESLTTEVGPRLAGTPQEARAREWAVDTLTELGFENVRVEEFTLDLWTRGRSIYEEVAITAPYPQPLVATSLGGAAATPEDGLEAEIVFFDSYDALLVSDPAEDALEGKLVFVNDRMTAAQTGEGYGWANRKRQNAWRLAEDRGAVGVLIRSVGTSSNRFAHTGIMSVPDDRRPQIPALAVSAPDADQIERIVQSGETLRVRLKTYAGYRGEVTSGNVIADIPGREAPEEIVVIGGHLDSWDTGTGALDDGAGVGITMAAAKQILDLPERPRRTIRVILWGSEEVGLVGARAYARARFEDGTLADHVIGSESDFGAREVWRYRTRVAEAALPVMAAVARELAPLGIIPGDNEGNGGPDMFPLMAMGVPVARLEQEGEDYFEFHHTPNDTFDKIDPDEIAQNQAAWAVWTYLMAELDVDYREPSEAAPSE